MNTEYMSEKIRNDVIILGGGAAGMMAALFSARQGADTRILEQNEKLGKKIYITGKGRCNLTNTADREEFLRQVPRNPRFLMSSLANLDTQGVISLINGLGTPTKVERGGRVFPESDKASDVTRALTRGLHEAGVQITLHTKIEKIVKEADGFTLTAIDGRSFSCRSLVLATGGLSYPLTGSTGDGLRFASEFGHALVPTFPSLVGMEMHTDWHPLLQGLSLKNVRIIAKMGKKTLYNELGEMLFTHFGVSGPLILELSSHMPADYSSVQVSLNLKPGLTPEQLDKRLLREFEENSRKQLSSIMVNLFPGRLAGVFPRICGIDPAVSCSSVTRAQRNLICQNIAQLPLPVIGPRPMDEAIITRGGVDVKSVYPGSMMSRLVPGLFFAGEMLDVDAHTGGFNLQIAWSTGAMAGMHAAAFAKETDALQETDTASL